MAKMEISLPKTDPALLDRLVEAARNYKMTPQERFEQRVSFIYGQCSGPLTKDQIRHYLTHGNWPA